MRDTVVIATVSVNTTPLAINKNIELIKSAYFEAVDKGADIVLTPELAITGYGLQDMFYVASSMKKIPQKVLEMTDFVRPNTYLAVGFPYLVEGGQ